MNISKEMAREKCTFCELNTPIYLDSGLSIELLHDNVVNLDYRNCACGAFDENVEIEHCFKCGRKLSKGE